MRARRRFHGYCPPASRRATDNVMLGSPDDYTSTVSGMTIHVVNTTGNPSGEISFAKESLNTPLSFDQDDESTSSVIELLESNKELQKAVLGIRRRNIKHRPNDDLKGAIVTSLSFDSRDDILLKKSPPLKEIRAIQRSFFPASEEEDEQAEFSIESDSDALGAALVETPDSSSVVSAVSTIENETVAKISLDDEKPSERSFLAFRLNYLIVTVAIMLADGLQGTHLYVLYEGYGYSVASLYCLGFVTGAVTSPITGPLVDRIGRKKAALIYCVLEIGINMLEQTPNLAGLIVSRMVGGITTNLLSSVFETWLDTEYRTRGFDKEKYEIVMRDSVVVSNLAAIASGYLAHQLAERLGPVGPFEGAVTCTAVALVVVAAMWTENYGSAEPGVKSVVGYLSGAVDTFRNNSKVLRVGIIQGLTCGSIQIFIFLWSPALRQMAQASPKNALGLDSHGEPAYGLIFGGFMAAGVLGGLLSPFVRSAVTKLLTPLAPTPVVTIEGEGEIRPMAVEFLAASCYIICACLLMTPYILPIDGEHSFSIALGAFLIYEFMVGVYMPCEGVIRSLYIPSDSRCSLMTLPRIIVNIAVSLGVISTNYVSFKTAFAAVALLMIISAGLQLSLISSREWDSLFGKVERLQRRVSRSLSFCVKREDVAKRVFSRSKSTPLCTQLSDANEKGSSMNMKYE
mmetsp:Transcript_31871/g.52555  ORF Transcript_31871/g.52555 Transcript_31871/m.52555 type:complete len:685 (+) Transcript_31871:36-2090(+)|eukprot:CAMPEP_0119009214 /NCGR_PEP_ID=MMETSP1176-20130426/4215_1 /TAXON_ID=265551 /ORGANISM="Synedropsis recta cf, Strain CCMP1620" /LENGTH=684 /DNA_ID=CAMNT_0006961683 /DNA_START=36 /DNA_END=2090 /DNA_ORIENTATION=-